MMEIKRFLRLGCLLWPHPFPPCHLLSWSLWVVELSCKTHEHKIDPQMGLLVITKVLLNSFHPLWSEGSLFNLGRNESPWASVTGEVLVRRPQIWCPCSVDCVCGGGGCKMSYYCDIPPRTAQSSLPFHLTTFRWFSCAIYRIYTCVSRGGVGKMSLHPLLKDEVV